MLKGGEYVQVVGVEASLGVGTAGEHQSVNILDSVSGREINDDGGQKCGANDPSVMN